MNKRLIPTAALALVPLALVACGGDGAPKTAEKGDAFCKLAEDTGEAFDDVSEDLFDPERLEETLSDAIDSAKETADAAPADIKKTIDELVDFQTQFFDILKDNDFDIGAAGSDPDFEKIAEDAGEIDEDLDKYLEDKCGIEPDEGSGDDGASSDTSGGAAPSGVVNRDNFLDFYALGAGAEITQEMKDCFLDAVKDVSDEAFAAAIDGTGSEEDQATIGLALLGCDIPVQG